MHLRGSASQAHRAHAFAVGRRSEHSRTRCARREDHPGNCTGARVQFGLAPATSLCRCGRQCARGEGRRVSRAPSSRPIVYARAVPSLVPALPHSLLSPPTLLLFLLCPPICLLACVLAAPTRAHAPCCSASRYSCFCCRGAHAPLAPAGRTPTQMAARVQPTQRAAASAAETWALAPAAPAATAPARRHLSPHQVRARVRVRVRAQVRHRHTATAVADT